MSHANWWTTSIEMLPFSLAEFFDWNKLNLAGLKLEQQAEAMVLTDDYMRASELKCSHLTIVTRDEERTIEKDGYTIGVVPISKF